MEELRNVKYDKLHICKKKKKQLRKILTILRKPRWMGYEKPAVGFLISDHLFPICFFCFQESQGDKEKLDV